ncbi:MAG: N-glycosylase/DNA lyase [Candidatus ainarchaeum sp.]|nr:N-glycosylase/DNA lyase [Candidatus ainarchaeum sp.]MDD5096157.1 N-glycosylase/DNA lyase [Candidatus ainarchaeum sp.]
MGKEELFAELERARGSPVQGVVERRLREFSEAGEGGEERWFSELCFCILTANYTAHGGMRIQDALGAEGFCGLPEKELIARLKELGHRFYNMRGRFIVEARGKRVKKGLEGKGQKEMREWLVENVKGLGWKEASHFLRNLGYFDLAIIDRHILSVLHKYGYIQEIPKALGRKRYLEMEKILDGIAKKAKMSQGELDLYLWQMKTGKVLK